MRTYHSLLRNQGHRATIVPARMRVRANGNFSDVGLDWLHSVGAVACRRGRPPGASKAGGHPTSALKKIAFC